MPDPTNTQTSTTTTTTAQPVAGDALVLEILEKGKLLRGKNPEEAKATAKNLLRAFVDNLVENERVPGDRKDTIELIQREIARIDQYIGEQVDAILHNKAFQDLEAAWRGLHYLVFN